MMPSNSPNTRRLRLLHRGVTRLTLALLGLAAVPALAQPAPDEPSEVRELQKRLLEAEQESNAIRRQLVERMHDRDAFAPALAFPSYAASAFGQRARLGLTVRMTASADDERGAVVEDVRDGGPAAEAGLRSGDVITHWNGEVLAGDGDEARPRRSAAAARLFDLARELEDGEEVELTYLRNGERRTAKVVAKELAWAPLPDARFGIGNGYSRAPLLDGALLPALGFFGGRWSDMKLLPIGPELGEYFAVDHGLLVLEPGEDDLFGLRIGDVILAVGDREPRDASHLMRILRSYEAGESINLEVMRKQQHATLHAEVPESEGDAHFGILAPRALARAVGGGRSI